MSETGAAPAAAPAPASAAPTGTPPVAANDNGAPQGQPPAPKPPSDYELVIGGEKRKYTAEQVRKALNMRADEEIHPRDLRALQMQQHSQQRWNEATQREKDAIARAAMLEQDPVKALADAKFGGDRIKARQALIATLGGELQEEAMPADERAKVQRQRELEAAERELKRRQEEEQRTEYERQVDQHAQQIGARLAQELTAVGVKPTPKTIADFAAHLMAARNEGRQVASLAEIAQEVRDEARESARGSLSALEGEALIEYLGEDVVKRVRAHDANRIRRELGTRPSNGTPPPKPAAPAKPKSTQQVLDEIRARGTRGR